MRKIFVNKNDTEVKISEAIEREPDDEITLVLPRGSKAGTAEALNTIRDKAAILGKMFFIESVDENLVALAQSLSIDARHPFLNVQGQSLSDIVPLSLKRKTTSPGKVSKKHPESRKVFEEDSRAVAIAIHVEGTEDEVPASVSHLKRSEKSLPSISDSAAQSKFDSSEFPEEEAAPSRNRKKRSVLFWLIIVAGVIGAGVWITGTFFSWARVSIQLKTVPFEATDALTGDKAATQFNTIAKTVPAEVFVQKKSISQIFPATGHATSPQKASGMITIFNSYGASPQQLVATTRFQTKDGKIYRLDKGVTVPGALRTGGKLVASSIDASVIADQTGPEYNLAAPEKLSIPGFSGTAKAAGFYGTVKSITGGSVGDTKVVSDQDIQDAKSKVTDILKTSVSDPSLNNRPEGFKVLDGADNFQVNKMTVNSTLDADGNFSVFASASYLAIAIKESDVISVFHEEAVSQLKDSFVPDFNLTNIQITYSNVKPDFDKGTLQFSAAIQSTATPVFSEKDFAASVAGLTVTNASAALASVPGLSDGKISVWPFWIQSLPNSPGKIRIDVK
jgi:hypothetical protein